MSRYPSKLLLLGLAPVALLAFLQCAQAQGSDQGQASEGVAAGLNAARGPATETAPAQAQADQAFEWLAKRRTSRLRMRGVVPSEEDRRTVIGMAKAHFPDLTIDDELALAEGSPPRDLWLGAVSFALKQLSHLERGTVRLSGLSLSIDGRARSSADYKEVTKALERSLPPTLTLVHEAIRPPKANPFVFKADLIESTLTLSGSVPSEEVRKEILALSKELFTSPAVHDELELASGAPADWDDAVTAALRALSRLESGTIALTGVALTIEGLAPDEPTAIAVAYQLRRDLPPPFQSSESIKWRQAAQTHSGNLTTLRHILSKSISPPL